MPNEQINSKEEAIELLNRMFRIPEGYRDRMFRISEGYTDGTIEIIVNDIIEAAIAEMKATTEKFSAVREEVQS